jgi:predicted acetyltransferase
MIDIKKIDSIEILTELKQRYLEQAVAPLDGMWLLGFVPMAQHFGFYSDNQLVGFCCMNSDGYLLQFYLSPEYNTQASNLFTLIAEQNSAIVGHVKGAFVSTAEPTYLSLCFDNYASFNVNALMYQMKVQTSPLAQTPLSMVKATKSQLSQFVEFAKTSIGAPEEWVTGYYTNLISRGELFGYWENGQLFASAECRRFDDFQRGYADLGMIVLPAERGKGLATRVMSFLISHARQTNLIPICSTEKANIGAQKAISKSGLVAEHRIIQFEYQSEGRKG